MKNVIPSHCHAHKLEAQKLEAQLQEHGETKIRLWNLTRSWKPGAGGQYRSVPEILPLPIILILVYLL